VSRRRNPETALQCTIVQHLQARGMPGLVFFHCPNGGYRTKAEAGILKAMGVRPGVSDLILLHQNKTFALELKAQGGRATEEQMAFLSDADRAGAFTALATGVDAALATLEAWGVIRPSVTMKNILQRVEAAE